MIMKKEEEKEKIILVTQKFDHYNINYILKDNRL